MEQVSVQRQRRATFVADAGAAGLDQACFDFDALLPTPIPGGKPPTVGQFDRVRRFPMANDVLEEPELSNGRDRVPFGEWLLEQTGRKGWIGDLAKAAKADRAFPRRGSADDVRRLLQKFGADGDTFEVLEDAELEWSTS